jgi:hypothetical protein
MSVQRSPPPPPGRWAPFTPIQWPQDVLQAPQAGTGMQMPHVSTANAERSRQESFTYSTTFNLPTSSPGSPITLIIPTDSDGDFWCDQIYSVGWGGNLIGPNFTQSGFPLSGTFEISDLRTSRSLTYPTVAVGATGNPSFIIGAPTYFFATLVLFSDDVGFDPGGSPYPDGFRSTSTLAEPVCFTRSGGISVTLWPIGAWGPNTGPNLVDIAFGGWKEYENAST